MFIFHFYFPHPLQLIDKLRSKLRSEGSIKALLGIVRCGHPDVLSQVARGIANFAKCESRATTQGRCLNQSNKGHFYFLTSDDSGVCLLATYKSGN